MARHSLRMWRDDVAQEMRVALWRVGTCPSPGYAATVCRQAAADFLRAELGRKGRKLRPGPLPDWCDPPDAADPFAAVDARDVLARARRRVTDRQWEALIASTERGDSSALARRRGISEQAVSVPSLTSPT